MGSPFNGATSRRVTALYAVEHPQSSSASHSSRFVFLLFYSLSRTTPAISSSRVSRSQLCVSLLAPPSDRARSTHFFFSSFFPLILLHFCSLNYLFSPPFCDFLGTACSLFSLFLSSLPSLEIYCSPLPRDPPSPRWMMFARYRAHSYRDAISVDFG